MEKLSHKFKRAREAAGHRTQAHAAVHSGISTATISKLENDGKIHPSIQKLAENYIKEFLGDAG